MILIFVSLEWSHYFSQRKDATHRLPFINYLRQQQAEKESPTISDGERERERERGWKWRQRNERGQTDAREIKEKKKFPISGVNDLLSSVCLNWCLCFRGLCTSPVVSEEIFITGQGTRTRITSNQSHLKWWEQRGGTELLVAGHIISGTF